MGQDLYKALKKMISRCGSSAKYGRQTRAAFLRCTLGVITELLKSEDEERTQNFTAYELTLEQH